MEFNRDSQTLKKLKSYEQSYANKLNNLSKMNKFLEKHYSPEHYLPNINIPVLIKYIEFLIII